MAVQLQVALFWHTGTVTLAQHTQATLPEPFLQVQDELLKVRFLAIGAPVLRVALVAVPFVQLQFTVFVTLPLVQLQSLQAV
jgi:hypothetical protein